MAWLIKVGLRAICVICMVRVIAGINILENHFAIIAHSVLFVKFKFSVTLEIMGLYDAMVDLFSRKAVLNAYTETKEHHTNATGNEGE